METSAAINQPSPLTRFLRHLARLSRPISLPLSGRRGMRIWALVHHQGRRSGAAYATPVAIGRSRDGFVIPIPFGEATQWVRNVQAAGGCTVRWNGRDHVEVQPEIIDRAAAAAAFPAFARMVIFFAGLDQALTGSCGSETQIHRTRSYR